MAEPQAATNREQPDGTRNTAGTTSATHAVYLGATLTWEARVAMLGQALGPPTTPPPASALEAAAA
eukprot:8676858-Prorocentrum_lima.AAC.1